MASTNKTTTLELSQFVGTDVPGWLTDYNSDMSKIDAFATEANSDISGAVQTANSANTTAQAASTAANSASSTAGNALTKATTIETNVALWKNGTATTGSGYTGNIVMHYNKTLGIISLSGILSKSGTVANGDTIATFPADVNPSNNKTFVGAVAYSDDGACAPVAIIVAQNGAVTIASNPPSTATKVAFAPNIDCAGWGNGWPNIQ